MRPSITVAITNYNHGEYLRGAVDSVLAQERVPDRIILVDDGSTDESRMIIDALPTRIDIVRQRNAGVVAARNRVLAMVDSSHLLFLDADDHLEPDCLSWLERAWQLPHRRRLAVAYTGARILSADGDLRYSGSRPWKRRYLGYANFVANTALFLTSALVEVGGYSETFATIGHEDWDLMLRLAEGGWIGRFVPLPLFTYRALPTGRNMTSLERHKSEVFHAIQAAHPWAKVGRTIPPAVLSPSSVVWMFARRRDMRGARMSGGNANRALLG